MVVHIGILVLALTNCLYKKTVCTIPSLPIGAVVECSTGDQEVPGHIACLFVYLFICMFVCLFVSLCLSWE